MYAKDYLIAGMKLIFIGIVNNVSREYIYIYIFLVTSFHDCVKGKNGR